MLFRKLSKQACIQFNKMTSKQTTYNNKDPVKEKEDTQSRI